MRGSRSSRGMEAGSIVMLCVGVRTAARPHRRNARGGRPTDDPSLPIPRCRPRAATWERRAVRSTRSAAPILTGGGKLSETAHDFLARNDEVPYLFTLRRLVVTYDLRSTESSPSRRQVRNVAPLVVYAHRASTCIARIADTRRNSFGGGANLSARDSVNYVRGRSV